MNIIRLPSTDSGQYDCFFHPPAKLQTDEALKLINDVIHGVNKEDYDNGGECIDGNSVEENIIRRLTALGFVDCTVLGTSNNWDVFDHDYLPSGEEPKTNASDETAVEQEGPSAHAMK